MENLKENQAAIDAATSTIAALYAQKTALERDFYAANENMADNADDIARGIKRLNFQIQKAEGERGQLEYRQKCFLDERQRLQNAIKNNDHHKDTLQKRLDLLKFDTKNCHDDILRADDTAKHLARQLAQLNGD
ncbi:MAG: hypothetical protein KIH69_003120 [Anaerolineae bacterium]|nr:hypothetical protein [Anaerolineae bacterium]